MIRQILCSLAVAAVCLTSCREDAAQIPQNRIERQIHAEQLASKENLVEVNAEFLKLEQELIHSYIDSLHLRLDSTAYGIHYQTLQEGVGRKAKDNDEVSILYSIRALEDSVYCEKYRDRDETLVIGKGKLPKGIEEAIKEMRWGTTAEFIIPSMWAYGVTGKGSCVPMRSPIVCKIVLKSIKPSKK